MKLVEHTLSDTGYECISLCIHTLSIAGWISTASENFESCPLFSLVPVLEVLSLFKKYLTNS